jgi:predicted nucleotide-binding protein
VIFELGYFSAKLSRGRTCVLRKGDVEIPSDLYGVLYIELDDCGGWKLGLAKELKGAGLKINMDEML